MTTIVSWPFNTTNPYFSIKRGSVSTKPLLQSSCCNSKYRSIKSSIFLYIPS